MPTVTFAFIILIVAVALLFDVANGWHDAANSIATVVSTRVLSPGVAVVWAAVFNFVAFAIRNSQKVLAAAPPSESRSIRRRRALNHVFLLPRSSPTTSSLHHQAAACHIVDLINQHFAYTA